jgi:hypothetical protein
MLNQDTVTGGVAATAQPPATFWRTSGAQARPAGRIGAPRIPRFSGAPHCPPAIYGPPESVGTLRSGRRRGAGQPTESKTGLPQIQGSADWRSAAPCSHAARATHYDIQPSHVSLVPRGSIRGRIVAPPRHLPGCRKPGAHENDETGSGECAAVAGPSIFRPRPATADASGDHGRPATRIWGDANSR